MIAIENLSKRHKGDIHALRDVNLKFGGDPAQTS